MLPPAQELTLHVNSQTKKKKKKLGEGKREYGTLIIKATEQMILFGKRARHLYHEKNKLRKTLGFVFIAVIRHSIRPLLQASYM